MEKKQKIGEGAVVIGNVTGDVGKGAVVIRSTESDGSIRLGDMVVGRNSKGRSGQTIIGDGASGLGLINVGVATFISIVAALFSIAGVITGWISN